MSDEQLPSTEQKQTMARLEALRKTTASGREYWLAREIAPVLGYETWRRFADVIGRAMAACAGNHLEPAKHFVETGKMVGLGSDANRQVVDYFLSRPACYLIAMNGDPRQGRDCRGPSLFRRSDPPHGAGGSAPQGREAFGTSGKS